jgi:thiamine biosynthesis protein ThiS
MNVTVNGESRRVEGSKTVEQLLEDLGLDGRKVAVERNREIVPKSQYSDVTLFEGDKFEIVHFIGGGAPESL